MPSIKLADKELFQLALDNDWGLTELLATLGTEELRDILETTHPSLVAPAGVFAGGLFGLVAELGEKQSDDRLLTQAFRQNPPLARMDRTNTDPRVLRDGQRLYPIWTEYGPSKSKYAYMRHGSVELESTGPIRQRDDGVIERLFVTRQPESDDGYDVEWRRIGAVDLTAEEMIATAVGQVFDEAVVEKIQADGAPEAPDEAPAAVWQVTFKGAEGQRAVMRVIAASSVAAMAVATAEVEKTIEVDTWRQTGAVRVTDDLEPVGLPLWVLMEIWKPERADAQAEAGRRRYVCITGPYGQFAIGMLGPDHDQQEAVQRWRRIMKLNDGWSVLHVWPEGTTHSMLLQIDPAERHRFDSLEPGSCWVFKTPEGVALGTAAPAAPGEEMPDGVGTVVLDESSAAPAPLTNDRRYLVVFQDKESGDRAGVRVDAQTEALANHEATAAVPLQGAWHYLQTLTLSGVALNDLKDQPLDEFRVIWKAGTQGPSFSEVALLHAGRRADEREPSGLYYVALQSRDKKAFVAVEAETAVEARQYAMLGLGEAFEWSIVGAVAVYPGMGFLFANPGAGPAPEQLGLIQIVHQN